MFKQPKFENEIILGMQRKLANNDSIEEGMQSLDKAVDYLVVAMDLLEELGLTKKSDQVLSLLEKIAAKNVGIFPSLSAIENALAKHGLSTSDLRLLKQQTTTLNRYDKARVTKILRKFFDDNMIRSYFGEDVVLLPPELVDHIIKNNKPMAEKVRLPLEKSPDEIVLKPIRDPQESIEDSDEITFTSLAGKRPSDPRKIPDAHTKNLDSNKMVKNLLDHGTVFNADDNLLDSDVNDLEVSEDDEEDFEDEAL